jgi:hypothetical protein
VAVSSLRDTNTFEEQKSKRVSGLRMMLILSAFERCIALLCSQNGGC